MQNDEAQGPVARRPEDDADGGPPPAGGKTVSRRQLLGRMSAVAAAGAAAWVVPEILTAKPAAGATLSGPATSGQTSGTESVVTTSATTSPHTLAFTGFNLERDVGIGSALVAGGWAMHLWASRAAGTVADGAVGTAGSVADPAGSPPAEGG